MSISAIIDDDNSDDFVPAPVKHTVSSRIPLTRRSNRLSSQPLPKPVIEIDQQESVDSEYFEKHAEEDTMFTQHAYINHAQKELINHTQQEFNNSTQQEYINNTQQEELTGKSSQMTK